ncbi:MAG: TIGR04141 family sporadically distributed protein [Erysipelotrichales bacterium]|nr:TIGR04141 family sporadically distributed protein [Erysipelotrichales bacterium]
MNNKTKLSIYLIKSEYQDIGQIVDEFENKQIIDENTLLYYKQADAIKPTWVSSFFSSIEETSYLYNANTRALLLKKIRIDNEFRIFGIVFGYGKSFLNDKFIEERFGLKVTLNTVNENSLRRISKVQIGGNQKASNEQMPSKANINEFDYNFDSDLINGVTGVSQNTDYLQGIISGSDSLNVTVENTLENIEGFLVDTYHVYKLDNYKNNFPWVDQITHVKNKALISNLDNELVKLIKDNNPNIWMAVPGVVEWDYIKCFKYSNSQECEDIIIDEVMSTIENFSDITQLKRKKIKCIGSLNELVIDEWSAYKCLFGEVIYENKTYCINNGQWYRVDNDYVKKINDDYESSVVSDIIFDDYTKDIQNEGEYTKQYVKKHKNDCLNLDTKVVRYGGGRSSIEICDILRKDKKLIHIKMYSGSATLSHLFNQGVVSAELLTDSNFLLAANTKIDEVSKENNIIEDYSINNINDYEVVFAIISKDESTLPRIPFFSKISYSNAKRRLNSMKIKYSICKIHKA